MALAEADKFLEQVEKSKKLRDAVKNLPHIVEVGKANGFNFTNADLSKALKKRWGAPTNRKDAKSESFTCCCI